MYNVTLSNAVILNLFCGGTLLTISTFGGTRRYRLIFFVCRNNKSIIHMYYFYYSYKIPTFLKFRSTV